MRSIRTLEASIANSANTITVTNGDVNVEALSDLRVSATAEAIAINDMSDALPSYSLSVGGTFAANEVLGDTTAFIADSTVITTGVDGDVLVSAINTSAVDATAEAGTNRRFDISAAQTALDTRALLGPELAEMLLKKN